MIILIGNTAAKGRLVYNTWKWGERHSTNQPPAKFVFGSDSFDEMAEKSGAATRAALGWLESARGPDADLNVELRALQHQIQVVEDDSQVGGPDYQLESVLDADDQPSPTLCNSSRALLGGIGRKRFDDAELMEEWSEKTGAFIKREDCELQSVDSYGWCGLDAINLGLSALELSPITKPDALETLSREEDDIRRNGICVNELEYLLNTKGRSVAVVDCQSGERFRLTKAKYIHSVINVGIDLAPHFIAMSQD